MKLAGSDARGAILLYHRVDHESRDPFQLCVTPEVFAGQMSHLRERYQTVGLREIRDGLAVGFWPERAVAVTFDDGYLDNLTTASPILMQHEVPATFFLTTEGLAQPHEYWWDRMAWSEDMSAADPKTFHKLAVHAPLDERATLLADRSCRWPAAPVSARPVLAAEARDLSSRAGHDIGSHTVRHLYLPSQDTSVTLQEMRQSREMLEAVLRRPVSALVYPFGGTDHVARAAAQAAGYSCAVTVESRPVWASDDPLLLPRLTAPPTVDAFERMLADVFESES